MQWDKILDTVQYEPNLQVLHSMEYVFTIGFIFNSSLVMVYGITDQLVVKEVFITIYDVKLYTKLFISTFLSRGEVLMNGQKVFWNAES